MNIDLENSHGLPTDGPGNVALSNDASGTFGMNAKHQAKNMAQARKIGARIIQKAVIPTTGHLK